MRLFVAVNFDKTLKDGLIKIRDELRSKSVSGNFTLDENLHLTLAFIGETRNIQGAKNALDRAFSKFNAFDICTEKTGRFSDLWWVGIKRNDPLISAAEMIQKELINCGFNIEKRKFKPHITIARQVIPKGEITLDIPNLSMKVSKISLMQSSRFFGKLRYTEIYHKNLILI